MIDPQSSPDYAAKLNRLRATIQKQGLQGFLLPMADAYQSEIVPPSDKRIEFLTGFTGSSAFVVVLEDEAVFFTDGRYTLQAEKQLPKGLYTLIDSGTQAPADWLKENVRARMTLGFDPWLHTAEAIERYQKALSRSAAGLSPVAVNPLDSLWQERPAPPCAPIVAHELSFAGQSSADKRKLIAKDLARRNLHAAVIADSASMAWLLNVRGGDVPCAPIPLSMGLVRVDGSVEWFVDQAKLSMGLDVLLGPDITCRKPEALPEFLRGLGDMKRRVLVCLNETPYAVVNLLKESGAEIERGDNPCALPKACKNVTELEGMRTAHRRDGAAMVKLLAWLDANARSGTLTEMSVEEKLLACRAEGQHFKGPSFATIAGAGANGAIVHYRSTEKTNARLAADMLFLLDSGGQYLDGTTDVTRTVAIGEPSPEMRDRFTRVLKGHIALASAVFPEGTTGTELDILARQYLWAHGLDYNHGTGHGVGSYLSVHEGPPSISHKGHAVLKPGMVVSNEPGYYKTGHYGIRIENLQIVVERFDLCGYEKKFLSFEPLTLVPIDRRLIQKEKLSEAERTWLNDYHDRVRHAIRPMVDEETAKWLDAATEAI